MYPKIYIAFRLIQSKKGFILMNKRYHIGKREYLLKRIKDIWKYQKNSHIKIAVGLAMIAIVTVACAADTNLTIDENTEENVKEVDLCGMYITEYDSIEGLDGLGPSLYLAQDNRFVFTYNILSSYLGVGIYSMENQIVTANTDDGKYTYVFHILEDGSLLFDVDKSAEVLVIKEDLKNIVALDTDTAFTKTNNVSSDIIE